MDVKTLVEWVIKNRPKTFYERKFNVNVEEVNVIEENEEMAVLLAKKSDGQRGIIICFHFWDYYGNGPKEVVWIPTEKHFKILQRAVVLKKEVNGWNSKIWGRK